MTRFRFRMELSTQYPVFFMLSEYQFLCSLACRTVCSPQGRQLKGTFGSEVAKETVVPLLGRSPVDCFAGGILGHYRSADVRKHVANYSESSLEIDNSGYRKWSTWCRSNFFERLEKEGANRRGFLSRVRYNGRRREEWRISNVTLVWFPFGLASGFVSRYLKVRTRLILLEALMT